MEGIILALETAHAMAFSELTLMPTHHCLEGSRVVNCSGRVEINTWLPFHNLFESTGFKIRITSVLPNKAGHETCKWPCFISQPDYPEPAVLPISYSGSGIVRG